MITRASQRVSELLTLITRAYQRVRELLTLITRSKTYRITVTRRNTVFQLLYTPSRLVKHLGGGFRL